MTHEAVIVVSDTDPASVLIMERLAKEALGDRVLVIGAGPFVQSYDPADLMAAVIDSYDNWKITASLKLPNDTHYRRNFRTGKPLRY